MPSTLACLMEWESACGTGGFRVKRQMCLGAPIGSDRGLGSRLQRTRRVAR
jgi:hypothetical protein